MQTCKHFRSFDACGSASIVEEARMCGCGSPLIIFGVFRCNLSLGSYDLTHNKDGEENHASLPL